MKKIITLLVLFFSITSIAQDHSSAIRLGFFSPQATEGGFILGYEGRYIIDEYIRTGWSVDWFHKKYVDQNYVQDIYNEYGPGINTQLNELRATTNLHELPVLFNATFEHPIQRRLNGYIQGSLGAELLLIYYRNFNNPDNDDLKAALDFSWRIGAGIAFEVGERSDLFAEINYHSSEPSWQYEVYDANSPNQKKIFERKFDMSGIMLRMGLRFYH